MLFAKSVCKLVASHNFMGMSSRPVSAPTQVFGAFQEVHNNLVVYSSQLSSRAKERRYVGGLRILTFSALDQFPRLVKLVICCLNQLLPDLVKLHKHSRFNRLRRVASFGSSRSLIAIFRAPSSTFLRRSFSHTFDKLQHFSPSSIQFVTA